LVARLGDASTARSVGGVGSGDGGAATFGPLAACVAPSIF